MCTCLYHMSYTHVFTADDVLTEQAIRKWFDEAHVAKGKSVFLAQMQRMVEWLDTAEEEDGEDDETV